MSLPVDGNWFPEVLDSTIMAAFKSCPAKFDLEFRQHWKSQQPNVHLHAGAAYAAGLEAARKAYYCGIEVKAHYQKDEKGQRTKITVETPCESGNSEFAIGIGLRELLVAYGDFQCPAESAKSCERTAGAYEFYFDRYPFASERAIPITLPGGRRGIEFSFAHPLPIDHPVTGLPLIYCGRMDMLCNYADGVFLEDDKTASQLGASWPKQWDLRSQFTGYAWGCKEAGIEVKGALIRGVSILKRSYDTLEAVTYRPQWMIDRWFVQLLRDIERMKQMWKEGYWDLNLDHACAEYGGCQFRQVHLMQEPDAWLNQYFERRLWNPITREEIRL